LEFTNPNDESYLGIKIGLNYDSRDREKAPHKGIYIDFQSLNYPLLRKRSDGFYKIIFDTRAYINTQFITSSTMALRFSAEKIWGAFPVTESAFLGGVRNLRGFTRQRYAGDALLYSAIELRSYLFPLKIIIPGRFGFTAFTETGRVYYSGEKSKKWHPAYGGGAWMSFLDHTFIANLSLANSSEDFIWYLTTDFMF
jgi:outer membrane protein assembly factor BamA